MTLFEELIKQDTAYIQKQVDLMVKNQEQESYELDFKSIRSLDFLESHGKGEERHKQEFARDLSSFANANGGVIIYGIEQDKNKPKSIIDYGEGIKEFNIEQLYQVANKAVQPTIHGLKIHPIPHPKDKDSQIIVILIPPSYNGAVMAIAQDGDCRYYQRNGTERKILMDWEVRLINSRLINPDLILEFDRSINGKYFRCAASGKTIYSELLITNPTIKNVGKVKSSDYAVVMSFPNIFIENETISINNYARFTPLRYDNTCQKVIQTFKDPIFPDMDKDYYCGNDVRYNKIGLLFKQHQILHPDIYGQKEHIIEYKLYSDNAIPKIYQIIIDFTNIRTLEDLRVRGLFHDIDDYANKDDYSHQFEIIQVGDLVRTEELQNF